MSEKLSHSPEHRKSREHETQPNPERSPEKPKHNKEREHHQSAEQKKHTIENIQKSIESTAVSGKEYSVGESETPNEQQYGTTRKLKKSAYKKVIKQTQKSLKGPERSFSKAIHQPTVERVSEVTAKTIARPTGILFGSICAFVVSAVVYYLSKRNGFTYNYLLFLLVFVGGYTLGLLIETIGWLVKTPRSK